MIIKKYDNTEYLKFDSRYDLKYWGKIKSEYLSVTKRELEEEIETIIDFMIKEGLDKLEILEQNVYVEFTIDLSNLRKITFLKELYISGGHYINGQILEDLTQLEHIFIFQNENNKTIINLSKLINLKFLNIQNCVNNITGFESLKNLETLILAKYQPKSRDFTMMNLPNLSNFELVQPRIETFAGMSNMKNIKCLTIFRSPTLKTIKEISILEKLEYLILDHAKNIVDFDTLKNNKSLKYLSILDSGVMDNLIFIRELKKLEFAVIRGTNVKDGNMTFLKDLRYAAFDNKKHYNYRFKDFKIYPK